MIPSLLTPGTAAFLHSYLSTLTQDIRGEKYGRPELADCSELPADPLMEHLLRGITPRIASITALSLCPTYSFARVYRRGSSLPAHRDRRACEISVSIHLGASEADVRWPLWIEGTRGDAAVDLAPGDGLLYRGIECKHWREPLQADEYGQVFLHYVDKDGPYRDEQYDRRESLNVLG